MTKLEIQTFYTDSELLNPDKYNINNNILYKTERKFLNYCYCHKYGFKQLGNHSNFV